MLASNIVFPKMKHNVNFKEEFQAQQFLKLAALHCQRSSYRTALSFLSEAVHIHPVATSYAKRSLVHLFLENHVLAASDATCAVTMDGTCAAGFFCRATAYIYLGDYENAMVDFTCMRNSLPNSKLCNDIYIECRNMLADTGKIEPFELPKNIDENIFEENGSIFDKQTVDEAINNLSLAGIVQLSGKMSDFLGGVVRRFLDEPYHLSRTHIFTILYNVLNISKESSNVVTIKISKKQKLTVIGDIRGNFDNLKTIITHKRCLNAGQPILFNGNLIGEYKANLSCLVFVFCLMLLYPEDIFVTRGEEECLEMCTMNGFENEVLSVYNETILKGFSEVFNWLPIAHVLNNSVLIVHGGLFEDEKVTIGHLQGFKRGYQPPEDGPLSHILCSDPWNNNGISKLGRKRGIWFGPDVTRQFCYRNRIDYVIRSHQIPNDVGFDLQKNHRCITINSSTTYATYLLVWGETTLFSVLHALKTKTIPDNCQCWGPCYCLEPKRANGPQVSSSVRVIGVPKLRKQKDKNLKEANTSCTSIAHFVSPCASQSTISGIRMDNENNSSRKIQKNDSSFPSIISFSETMSYVEKYSEKYLSNSQLPQNLLSSSEQKRESTEMDSMANHSFKEGAKSAYFKNTSKDTYSPVTSTRINVINDSYKNDEVTISSLDEFNSRSKANEKNEISKIHSSTVFAESVNIRTSTFQEEEESLKKLSKQIIKSADFFPDKNKLKSTSNTRLTHHGIFPSFEEKSNSISEINSHPPIENIEEMGVRADEDTFIPTLIME